MAQELGNGRRRGERTDGGGAWRAQMVPRGGGFGKTRGARGGLGLGLGTCPPRWPAAAYGVASGQGAGRREVEEPASGNLVNKPKFQNQFCNFKFFSLFWASNEKVLNTTFSQFFEIYNFRVLYFFIRAVV